MKKSIYLFLAAGLFTFASCESAKEERAEDQAEQVEESAEEQGEQVEEAGEEKAEQIEEGADTSAVVQ
ncbi:hypothetical protein [Pontibacter vulgaris]|uniref:hypothetical protein n=1 Tax=Pontibacter vulgaris TaxID=2905679 RepID=UPI001FA6E0CF|nr:hypothetical protein [Pontibacter vulgaris]